MSLCTEIENDPKLSSSKKEDKIWKLLNDTGYKYEYVEALRKIGQRDIVDFVELNDFNSETLRDKFGKTLEAKTLEEIPSHFMRFIQFHNILPPNKIAMDEKELEGDMDLREGSVSRQSSSYDGANMIDSKDGNMIYQNRNIQYDNAPLPQYWDRAYDNQGRMYYVNHKMRLTQWMVCTSHNLLITIAIF